MEAASGAQYISGFLGTASSTSGSSYWACHGHCGFPGFGSLVCSARRPSLSGLLVGLLAAIAEYWIFLESSFGHPLSKIAKMLLSCCSRPAGRVSRRRTGCQGSSQCLWRLCRRKRDSAGLIVRAWSCSAEAQVESGGSLRNLSQEGSGVS